jgi:putative (di)nucleoside polyphosphate hydrolase
MKQNNVYFRAGVGIILIRDSKVAFFERADERGHWQFPQGGMYAGETPEEAMYRELQEETGITQDEVADIHQVPFLVSYAYPREVMDSFQHTGSDYIGQTQFWYILTLKDDVQIDLSKASDVELVNKQWIDPEEALEAIIEWKRPAYKQLISYLQTEFTN